MQCSIVIREEDGIDRTAEPLTLGQPFPRGQLMAADHLRLCDHHQVQRPLQVEVLDHWIDGSIKWALLDFQATVEAGKTVEYHLQTGDAPVALESRVTVVQTEERWQVDTGMCRFSLDTHRLSIFDEVVSEGVPITAVTGNRIVLIDAAGQAYEPWIDRLSVSTPGPLRLSLDIHGELRAAGRPALARFRARLSFYAGSGLVALQLTIHNPRAAKHVGGLWDLGDPGSIHFKEFTLQTALHADRAQAMWRAEPQAPWAVVEGSAIEIYQDSSGGENWQSANHVNADGRVLHTFQGYRVQVGARMVAAGRRATPALLVYDPADDRSIAATVEGFWQNFPKALEVNNQRLSLGLFPRQAAYFYELQGGEQKTHTVYLYFGPSRQAAATLTAMQLPLVPRVSPEWYAASRALAYLTPQKLDANQNYLSLIETAIAGPHAFVERRELIDEYGWRHFGDLYADHEAVGHHGASPLISHYNNQYDAIHGLLMQYLRSGDPRWFALGRDLARHVIDIDIYHTQEDRPAYNGGLFWHTDHYVDAATATHRCYSRANRDRLGGDLYGGGLSNEQNYTTGLLHYYFMTGDAGAREAVLNLADWVIAMDRGDRGLLSRVDRRPTGLASSTASRHYHGPGRGAGNSINALVDAYMLTREPQYLAKAEELIRRCIHPADDIAAWDLADVEHRWSYTVFLQTLGKYLDVKIEHNMLDFMYAYGRDSLLHYAQWMLEHEVPYATVLDRVEIPTETWPAQDIRKSNVFDYAAKHADEPLRTALLQKGEFFFQTCIRDLRSFETCTLTRPLVLLLTNAFRHVYFQLHPDERAPRPDQSYDYGHPAHFTPQLAELHRAKAWLMPLVQKAKAFGRRCSGLLPGR